MIHIMIVSSNSIIAFLIGAVWAVLLHAYGRVRTATFFEDTSFARPIADVLFVGGGTGLALYATHYALSAIASGAIGYVVTAVVVRITSKRGIYGTS